MKSEIKFALLSAALAAFTLPGFAQSADASAQGSASASTPVTGQTVQQRAENQQDRIANGMKDGELTSGEASNLETKEGKINQEARAMRKEDGGHLTAADKAKLTQQQNQLSKQIYQDKHNAATQNTNPKSEIGKREENQQDRIAQGVKSGQLTPGETANLEKKEAAINKETRADRAANGGKLTPAEKAQVTHQQNQVSKQIYADKHNANTAHFGNNKVGQRRENQQDRIAQGIKSGQLTPAETTKLEKQQKGINKQVAKDRKANGGTLTAGEKKQINKEQNKASRNIYRKKHNAATQSDAKPKQ